MKCIANERMFPERKMIRSKVSIAESRFNTALSWKNVVFSFAGPNSLLNLSFKERFTATLAWDSRNSMIHFAVTTGGETAWMEEVRADEYARD